MTTRLDHKMVITRKWVEDWDDLGPGWEFSSFIVGIFQDPRDFILISSMRVLVSFFMNPINIIVILYLATIWAVHRKGCRWTKTLTICSLILFLIVATNPVPDFLVRHLESKYEPYQPGQPASQDRPFHILVLGSGHTADPDLPPTGQLSSTAMHRLTEGIRLLHLLPASNLIVSGYGASSNQSQAEVLARAAVALGVREEVVHRQESPSNTAEEAVTYKQRFGNKKPLILVTSAAHMPRAMVIFQHRGLDPIPAPADFRVKDDPEDAFSFRIFSHENFQKVQIALHEYIGILWERWFEQT